MTHQLKIRLSCIFLFFAIIYAVILVNLYIIQVRQNNFFNNVAKHQYNVVVTTAPPRAEIYDRHGRPLALNISRLAAFTIPSKISDNKKLRSFLTHHFPQATTRLDNPPPHFMYIKRQLSTNEINTILKADLKDLYFLKEPCRFYPVESVGPVIGLTDSDTKGIAGIEFVYDKKLAGTASTYFLQKEARSGHYYFNKETRVKGTEGTPITLTLDSTLQFLAYEELKETISNFEAHEGAVLIYDPTNGDILTMASYPDFDQNNHTKIDIETTKNRSVTETYELGSVMKIFLALAALEEGVVTSTEIIDCEDKKVAYINGVRIGTVHAHGKLTFSEVIERSNNIGTSKVAQRLGPKLYDHYRRCGFGHKTGLNFPGEQQGFLNPPSQWTKQSVFSYSFGYELSATLLQLARSFSILATGGYLTQPRLIASKEPAQHMGAPLYSESTLTTVRDILRKTITQGTARRAHIAGYEILGKTGTANLLTNGKYDTSRNIFTFVGLIEKGPYKRIIVTFIKESSKKNALASSVTAPLFERVAQKMLIHEKII